MKKQAALKQYNLVIYPIDFVVAIGDVEEEVNNTYKPYEEGYNHIAPPQDHSDAATYRVKNNDGTPCIMCWFKDVENFTSSMVTHECDHAAMEIFLYIGSEVNLKDQEPFCYLAGNLARLAVGTFYDIEGIKPPIVKQDKFYKSNGKGKKTKKH